MASGTFHTFGYNSVDNTKQPLLSTSSYEQPNGYGGPIMAYPDRFSTASAMKTTRFIDEHAPYDYKCGLSPVRRMFCLLALFDFLFVFLMWIIYAQLFSSGLKDQFKREVLQYNINSSLFDLVCSALLRTLCLGMVYALLKSKKWYMVGLTTAASTVFVIVKVFEVGRTLSHGQPMSYLLLIVSFIICWAEVWHFDFQVIPTELKHAKKHFTSSLPTVIGEDKAFGSWYSGRPQTDQRSFYTANCFGEQFSSDSEASFDSFTNEAPCSLSESTRKQIVNEGKQAMKQVLRMHNVMDGWKLEKDEQDEIKVHSRDFDDIGRVYKCWAPMDCPAAFLHKFLWEDVESQNVWNPNVVECRVVDIVDRHTDICYVMASEAAGGMIKSRDFVNVRHSGKKGNLYMNCAVATVSSVVPEKKGVIRAENRPGGFIVVETPNVVQKTDFYWLVSSNLKGWIPQTIIDQTMASVLVGTVRSLRGHIATLPQV